MEKKNKCELFLENNGQTQLMTLKGSVQAQSHHTGTQQPHSVHPDSKLQWAETSA